MSKLPEYKVVAKIPTEAKVSMFLLISTVVIFSVWALYWLGVVGWNAVQENTELKPALENKTVELEIIKTSIGPMEMELEQLRNQNKHLQRQIEEPAKRNRDDLVSYITARFSEVPVETATSIAYHVDALARKHDIGFELVVGIIEVESSFDPRAKSSYGSRGLMQVTPKVWKKTFGVTRDTDLHDIELNIDCGIRVMKKYLKDNKGKLTKALANYNGSTGDKFANKIYLAMGKFSAHRESTSGVHNPVNGGPHNDQIKEGRSKSSTTE